MLISEGWTRDEDENWRPSGWNFGVPLSDVRMLRFLLEHPPEGISVSMIELLYAQDFYVEKDRWHQRKSEDDATRTVEHNRRNHADHEAIPGLSHDAMSAMLKQQGGIFSIFWGLNIE